MGILDQLFGGGEQREEPMQGRQRAGGGRAMTADEQALDRYRYMLRTAPPEDIERAHEEAFTRLTPEQRRMVLEQLSEEVPASERARQDDPRSLARMATRAEMRRPGTVERTLSGPAMGGMGMGMGGMIFGSLVAGFVGSAIASSFFANDSGYDQGYEQGTEDAQGAEDSGDGGSEYGSGEDGGSGDMGGDFGGGDFGGGDFGGGDFGGGGDF